MKKLALITVLLTATTQTTMANSTIFSCFMKNGKHLSIEKVGSNYQYSYGKPGKPEMVFTNRISDVENTRDSGTQAMNITMFNKGVEYFIWNNFVREAGGGVSVSKNGKELANTYCDPNREIYGLENSAH
ncbi:hypothetical protein [Ursidibacter arcticus]|uniref:hypothetical protein n=1 Tax=Ursidibacter arcticus TaxID=1524965 RepID=UPI0012FB2AAC|nr:hypothetical protein [Ursidibacter arcticus]KAE9535527.1 hypothetical protein A1D25_04590 [Ursidibacter arcticus]